MVITILRFKLIKLIKLEMSLTKSKKRTWKEKDKKIWKFNREDNLRLKDKLLSDIKHKKKQGEKLLLKRQLVKDNTKNL
jgi:hypothetical protein